MKRSLLNFLFVVLLAGSHYSIAQGVTAQAQYNTSCGAPNGAASASVGGSTEGYTFEWREGSDNTGPVLAFGPTIANLPAGIYTVSAFDQGTGTIVGIISVAISDMITIPLISIQSTPNTTCSVMGNGSLTATVGGASTDYQYEWYEGTDINGAVISFNPVLDQRSSGIYTVVVTDVVSHCQAIATAIIADSPAFPEVSVQPVANTSCSLPNGSATALVNGLAADYFFEWYEGPAAAGTVISTAQAIDAQPAGTYTVKVTGAISACQAIATGEVADAKTPPVVIVIATSNTDCTVPNGSLTATTEAPAAQYTFAWYLGTDTSSTPLGMNAVLNHLSAGVYTVMVTDIYTGCITVISGMVADACEFSREGFSAFAHDVVTHQKKNSPPSFSYYPNPVSATLWVNSTGSVSIAMIDHKGTVVLHQDIPSAGNNSPLDVSGLSPGRYIMKITENGKTSNYQVIVKK